jgi:hypothetical protein
MIAWQEAGREIRNRIGRRLVHGSPLTLLSKPRLSINAA